MNKIFLLISTMLISFFITIILPNKTITYDPTNTIEKNNKYSMKDLIKEPNLGEIPSNSINDIRNALYYKNPTLNQVLINLGIKAPIRIIFTNVQKNKANVVLSNYTSKIENDSSVTFKTNNFILHSIIKTPNLEILTDNNETTLRRVLKEKNLMLNIDWIKL
ncbi:hypothetical protein [Spiroplasma endosymbiont of Seladonia tumulorum]|uniref:hypothetical protein n=1 Tax=Spiroplasma endosymbiont of Seladonia tumulorum TaxID=3066321 RepID=UPI0030D2167F